MTWGLLSFFVDPLLRGPTWGTLLMSLAASLASVLVFVRRQALVGETLSHAAYPGVVFATLITAPLGYFAFKGGILLFGAFIFAWLGFGAVHLLCRWLRISKDAALCAVLSTFFGVGVLVASYLQLSYPIAYRQIEAYLYGQAATMTDGHIALFGSLFICVLGAVVFFYKELKALCFDKDFAHTSGLPTFLIETIITVIIAVSVVVGLRSVGVVLMAAMLVAPPVAARQWTHSFFKLFLLSALFASTSAVLGVVLSTNLSRVYSDTSRLILPTGPLIVLIAAAFAFISLLFAPKRGYFPKLFRIVVFQLKSAEENLIKSLWRKESALFNELKQSLDLSTPGLFFLLRRLKYKKLIELHQKTHYRLTKKGKELGDRVVRLHRLWELYLTQRVGMHKKNVHDWAEKIEHILSPELEAELTTLLNNPDRDPHNQPIPSRRGSCNSLPS